MKTVSYHLKPKTEREKDPSPFCHNNPPLPPPTKCVSVSRPKTAVWVPRVTLDLAFIETAADSLLPRCKGQTSVHVSSCYLLYGWIHQLQLKNKKLWQKDSLSGRNLFHSNIHNSLWIFGIRVHFLVVTAYTSKKVMLAVVIIQAVIL